MRLSASRGVAVREPSMKALGILVLAMSLLGATVALTCLSAIEGMTVSEANRLEHGLSRGNLGTLLAWKGTWRRYPSMPSRELLLDVPGLVVAASLLAAALYVARFHWRQSLLLTAATCLLAAAVPCAVGAFVLQGNRLFEIGRPFIIVMLVSIFYSLAGCAGCTAAHLLQSLPLRLPVGRTEPIPAT